MTQRENRPFCQLLDRQGGRVEISDLYRVYLGKRQGQKIWIVDGAKVVSQLYPPFIMGGNDQRYRFNPDNDVWIDNRIGCEELKYTVAHELIERQLMREKGMTYGGAHNAGLALEKRMRDADLSKAERRAKALNLPLATRQVYRSFYKTANGLAVWIVDGPLVRKELEPDFCFGGHDLAYSFIPAGEIWLDSAMSCEHMHYALVHQLEERRLIDSGVADGDADRQALAVQIVEQQKQAMLAEAHEKRLAPVSFGVRERGVKAGRNSRKKR